MKIFSQPLRVFTITAAAGFLLVSCVEATAKKDPALSQRQLQDYQAIRETFGEKTITKSDTLPVPEDTAERYLWQLQQYEALYKEPDSFVRKDVTKEKVPEDTKARHAWQLEKYKMIDAELGDIIRCNTLEDKQDCSSVIEPRVRSDSSLRRLPKK